MDEGSNRAVRTMFKRLYDDGLIYRAERMVNWSPAMRSVLSRHRGGAQGGRRRAGLDPLRRRGRRDRRRHHAGRDDAGRHRRRRAPRRRALPRTSIGREIELPLVGRRIPILADDHVDPAFGTGAVKVTPAHDPNDFEIGRRHGLPMPSIMDESGVITGTGTEFDGMDRFEARVAVREALRAQGRIVAEKRPYRHSVGHTQRAPHEPIEPRLSLQWFVKVGPLAKAAGDAVRDGRVVVHPKELEPRWFALGGQHVRLVHLPPAVVGPPHPGLVRPRRRGGLPGAGRGAAGRLDAGRRRPRHLVLLRAVAVLHARLAGRHPGPAALLPDVGAGHRLRHPVLLGRPDDDVRAVRDGRRAAVRHHRAARHGARRARQEDVEVGGQHGRPDRVDGPLRHRRGAVRAGPRREPGHGHAARRRRRRRRAQLHHQAVERHPVRAGQRRVGASGRCPTRRSGPTPTAGFSGACARSASRSTRCWTTSSSPRPPRRSTTSRGASSATGTSSWPSRSCAPSTADGTRAVLGHVLDALLKLLHPVVPFLTETLWTALTGGESVVDRAVAGRGGRAGRRRRGDPDRRPAEAGHRGPPVPHGAGHPGQPPGRRRGPSGCRRRSPATASAVAGPAGRSGRRLRADGDGGGRAVRRPRARRARHLGRDRRRRRACPAGPGPGRGAEGARRRREEAGQPEVRGEGARRRSSTASGRAGTPRSRRSSGSRRGWRRCRREPGRRGFGDPTSAAAIDGPDLGDAAPRARSSRGGGARARPGGCRRGRRARHVLDAVRGGDTPDVVPAGSSVAGFAEFLAVEAVLDKRWPETRMEPSLDRIADLVELLGDPQRGYPVVHLTGTNGKTSTARMVDALLSEIGLRTGRYTSPHLQSAIERINIDNRPITPERYVEVYRDVAPFVDLVDAARHERAAEQVRGAHRDGVRRVRGRPGGGRDRRGRPGRAVGRHERRRRHGRGGHADRAGPRRVPGHRRARHRPGEGRDHQARRRRGTGRAGRRPWPRC